MVNADDFTYSKGYLGLLSALGASLGITFCCVPSMPAIYRHYRQAYCKREKSLVQVNENTTWTVVMEKEPSRNLKEFYRVVPYKCSLARNKKETEGLQIQHSPEREHKDSAICIPLSTPV